MVGLNQIESVFQMDGFYGLDILADVLRNPAFAQEEMDKLRTRWLALPAQLSSFVPGG